MKKWTAPTMEELNFRHTATIGSEEDISGMITTQDDWCACNPSDYWAGTGESPKAAKEKYETNWGSNGGWGAGGGWGSDGGWGSNGGWGSK